MNSCLHCQKSRYFQYRHLSEDLNNPKSIEQNEDRDMGLNSGSDDYENNWFFIKLSKNVTKSILLFFQLWMAHTMAVKHVLEIIILKHP